MEKTTEHEICVFTPYSWGDLPDDELKDRIARWRAGENFGEPTDRRRDQVMRSDLSIEERQRAEVHTMRLVDLTKHHNYLVSEIRYFGLCATQTMTTILAGEY